MMLAKARRHRKLGVLQTLNLRRARLAWILPLIPLIRWMEGYIAHRVDPRPRFDGSKLAVDDRMCNLYPLDLDERPGPQFRKCRRRGVALLRRLAAAAHRC